MTPGHSRGNLGAGVSAELGWDPEGRRRCRPLRATSSYWVWRLHTDGGIRGLSRNFWPEGDSPLIVTDEETRQASVEPLPGSLWALSEGEDNNHTRRPGAPLKSSHQQKPSALKRGAV